MMQIVLISIPFSGFFFTKLALVKGSLRERKINKDYLVIQIVYTNIPLCVLILFLKASLVKSRLREKQIHTKFVLRQMHSFFFINNAMASTSNE